jgi:endonuclease/exonuclease/phosphatase family metal-dependent hydrolase
VWQWNVAGHTIHQGSTGDGMVDAATSSIVNRDADFASFNELCHGQYEAIQTKLLNAGWPEDPSNYSRFAESRPASAAICDGTETFGNAIFSKAPLAPAARFTLPTDGSVEHRNLMCAALENTPHVRFCTTHLTTSNAAGAGGQPNNVNQLNFVLDRLEDYHAAGDTVIIAGDFNAQPNYGRLNNWYSSSLNTANNPNNTGHYRELDDNDTANCLGYGEWTGTGPPGATPPCGLTQAKIDEIFVREDRIAGSYSGDSLAISTSCSGDCSDHRILIGSVTVYTS